VALAGIAVVIIAAILSLGANRGSDASWHRLTEGNSLAFTVLVLVAILVGGIVEIIPTVVVSKRVPTTPAALAENPHIQQPYSPLEVEGRDLYVREGCYTCHSQMIRPFRHETLRYGDYSRMEEFIYDRPFQWGSKRTGPDLHRVGGKYANLWHYLHMIDPRSTSPGSNMPSYAWLKTGRVDFGDTGHKLKTLAKLGVPYDGAQIAGAAATAQSQAALIVGDLQTQGVALAPDAELTALIAYLQRLGRGPQPTSAGGN
jgi:cytochrome c oxidase cbb3-type subunit I/II